MAIEGYFMLEEAGLTDRCTILDLSHEFSQPIDRYGKPTADPRSGLVYITLRTADLTRKMYDWMLSKSEVQNCTLLFKGIYRDDQHKWHLLKAFCVNMQTYFNNTSQNQMCTKIAISAPDIVIEDLAHYTNDELWSDFGNR